MRINSYWNESGSERSLGIYIHIPFCLRKCLYCDFCSFPEKDEEVITRYVSALCRQIRDCGMTRRLKADTVFFGGGTPTRLSESNWNLIFQALHDAFEIAKDSEITTECNPATVDSERLKFLKQIGINRLSIGTQSSDNHELQLLGRLHTFEDAVRTYNDARTAGFDNINLDMMFGIPDQTIPSLGQTVQQFMNLQPEHISAYALQLEEGTPLERNKDRYSIPDDDTVADMYEFLVGTLAQNGYDRYEISNFALRGHECRHNLKYWNLDPYIGFGLTAHSLVGRHRFYVTDEMAKYCQNPLEYSAEEELTPERLSDEYVVMRLRLRDGLDENAFLERFGTSFERYRNAMQKLAEENYLEHIGSQWRIRAPYFFTSNWILSRIIPD